MTYNETNILPDVKLFHVHLQGSFLLHSGEILTWKVGRLNMKIIEFTVQLDNLVYENKESSVP